MDNFPAARFFDRTTQPTMLTLVLLASISALAMNIYLPSLPQMAMEFSTTPAAMGLSVGVYLGTSALIQLFAGPISDRIGRRKIVQVSLIIFVIASISCAYAQSFETFLMYRGIQSVAATCMIVSRAIVRDTTDTASSGSRIAYVTMGMAVVPMFSPALGGFIDTNFGWEGTFFVLAGLGVIMLMLSYFDQGETAPVSDKSILGQFQNYPILLTSKRFWGYCLASAFGSGSFFAYLGGAPAVGAEVYALDPQSVGLFLGAPAFGYFFGNFIAGRYSKSIGIDLMVLYGLVLALFGMSLSFAISALGYGSAFSFFGFMTFVGLGNGMSIPNATAGMLAIKPELAGTASGLGSAMMIGGGAALSALAGPVLHMGSGDLALIALMWLSVLIGILLILLVIKRNRTLTAD
ncbi:drug resistance transporter, Bcr/CflA subfamily [Rhodobacteraceae bacterium HIMB11]|nr:drug resistance transporter, Bcr/CflA subfamily [Rhodobacteraceae bacterium HIMB11]